MEFIKTYFTGEKNASALFVIVGIAAILFSIYALIKWQEPFYKGFAIPVILVGLIQIVVGGTVYLRTDKQSENLQQLFTDDAGTFAQAEAPRMAVVMKSFKVVTKIEVAFVVIGVFLILFLPTKPLWLGFGVGLLIQGSLMLTADVFAEKRGHAYVEQVARSQYVSL